jgi:phosphoribosylformylglycinamidine cyclo-ligase
LSITYRDAGVDVEKGYEAVKLMRGYVEKTFNKHVLTGLGSFGGMYDIGGGNILVAGTDGVGTKLKAAFAMDKHDTVGIDCVAMCANDVVCQGAQPLFFLDYIATGVLEPAVIADVVRGVSEGCLQAGCALIGGETAEMPGFYPKGEYDLAGFCVGIVKKNKIINGSSVKEGNVIIGLPSSGIHSNGFSLVRKLYSMDPLILSRHVYSMEKQLGEILLTPTVIYVKTVLDLIEKFAIRGIAHITGGGFIENIPRTLPKGLCARIDLGSWEIPEVFDLLMQDAQLSDEQAYNTFNMGIGMVLIVGKSDADAIVRHVKASGKKAYVIGSVAKGDGGVTLCG